MKTRLLYLTICILLAGNVLPLKARMIRRQPVGEIPFTKTSDHRIYITAFVNGSDSLKFLVDTGASSLVLNTNSPRLAGRIHVGEEHHNLGTTGSNLATYSHDNSVQAGTVHYDNAGCIHLPFPADYWDGVFGLNALSAFNVEINYDDSKIYCYPKESLRSETKHLICLPFEYIYNVPFVRIPVKLCGRTHRLTLEIDTGSDRVIDLSTPFVRKHQLLAALPSFATSYIQSSDGGEGELRNVLFDEVVIGGYCLPRIPGALSTLNAGMLGKEDIDGMIGNNFLKRFNMLIDFNESRIYLEPNHFLYTPFYDFLVKE